MKPILLSLGLELLLCLAAFAQGEVYVETDKKWYAASDSVELAFFRSGKGPKPAREVLQVRLISPAGQELKRMKVVLEQGAGQAGIRLPEAQGVYLLQVWSAYGFTWRVAYINHWIAAYAPARAVPEAGQRLQALLPPGEAQAASPGVTLTGNLGAPRSQVSLAFEANQGGWAMATITGPVWQVAPPGWSAVSHTVLTPDTVMGEELLLQRINSNEPVTGMIAWYLGQSQMSGTRTAVLGKARILAPPSRIQEDLYVFEATPFGNQSLKITAEASPAPALPEVWPALPPMLPEMEAALAQVRKQELIRDAFGSPVIRQQAQKAISVVPDFSYSGRDYVGIDRLRDFFMEMTTAVFAKKGPNPGIRLLNLDNSNKFMGAPLFIVDGRVEMNEQEVLDLPWTEIERVELYSRVSTARVAFGMLAANGAMVITTRRPQDPPGIRLGRYGTRLSDWRYPIAEKKNFETVYPDFHPDFRTVEAWVAPVRLDEKGRAHQTISISDGTGPLWLRVVWFLDDGSVTEQIRLVRE